MATTTTTRRASRFILCFDAHRQNGRVWCIRANGRWHTAKRCEVGVPVITVYRGKLSMQPKAYLEGLGVIRRKQDCLIVTAA